MTERQPTSEVALMALSVKNTPTVEDIQSLLDLVGKPQEGTGFLVMPEYFLRGKESFDPITLSDPRIGYLEAYSKDRNMHLVFGAVLENDGRKTLSGLFISPRKGLHTGEISSKINPTSFEMKNGVVGVNGDFPVLELDNKNAKITIIDCFDLWREDLRIRQQMKRLGSDAPQIIAHMRGFDLDDPKFGNLSSNWTIHFVDLCMMTKSYGVASTGIVQEGHGSFSEIVNPEGKILDRRDGGLATAGTDLRLQESYRQNKHVSACVARF